MLLTNYSPIFFSGKLFTTDIDGTFLISPKGNFERNLKDRSYDVDSAKKAFDAVRRNGFDDVLINTGRDFTEFSELQDILQTIDVPVTAISLEDGKRLLKKPTELTPEQWMAQLFGGKINYTYYSDKIWDDVNSEPLKKIAEFLTEKEGFIHKKDKGENSIFYKDIQKDDAGVAEIKGNPRWKVEIVPPGITVKVSISSYKQGSKINLKRYNSILSDKIYNVLKQDGFPVSSPDSKMEVSYVNKFKRGDVNKGAVANYLKSTFSEDTDEVRAGNASNDYEMLNDDSVQVIVVGHDEGLRKSLAGKKDILYVEEGKLDEGIDTVCAK